jgi:hypothetical protein
MALRAYAYVLQGAVSPALGWVFLIIGAQALFPSVLAYSLAGAILGAFGALLSQKMK